MPSYLWPENQRLHQYSGGHDETYGGFRINIDGDYIGGATADTSSPIPDNTFIQVDGTSDVYVIAGGAPIYVDSWSDFSGGAQPVEPITPQQFSQLPRYPANGTFLTTTTGLIYRVAGGAPILITTWDLYGAPEPSVTVDEWDLQNIGNPLVDLRATPLNGTLVEGLPSDTYWSFKQGVRRPAKRNAAAVGVDDQGLAAFPEYTPPVVPAGCVVPKVTRLSLVQARGALSRAHCLVGKVHRPHYSPRYHRLRVVAQSATPHSAHRLDFKVNLRLA